MEFGDWINLKKVVKECMLCDNKIKMMHESRISNRSSQSAMNLPKKEEWAIIYQQRAVEMEKAKSVEKLVSRQKRDTFKKQLDQQLAQKYTKGEAEKDEDRRYYQYIVSKAQEMKEREEKQKFQKFLQFKQLEEHNRQVIQAHQEQQPSDKGKVYNLDIGMKSEREKRERAEAIRKDVIETLDRQRQQKNAQASAARSLQMMQSQANLEYQNNAYQSRSNQNKKYEQNEKVYNYYRDLYQQKVRRDRELEHKLVDEVLVKRGEEDSRRREQESNIKERKNLEMRDTLEKQVQLLNSRRQEEGKVNPEQANYSFINGIFRQKKPTFDKKEYSLYLEKQAEQQRMNRLQQKYMTDEEYRLNSNQLSKAINGNYTYDHYQDRSMVTLGDRGNTRAEPLGSQDAQVIKTKLQAARNNQRNRSLDPGATDRSALF